MDSGEFKKFRHRLNKTQRQMAQLLATSLKAIHSYEQGWRSIPTHIERQVLFLAVRAKHGAMGLAPCWDRKNCPPEHKAQCPAWEFKSGDLCWFICGTHCDGSVQKNWKEKMAICRSCHVLNSQI